MKNTSYCMLSRLALACAMVASPPLLRAQDAAGQQVPASVGVLLVAHGAGSDWNARVDSLAAAVRRTGRIRGPVAMCFLMGPGAAAHRFQDVVDSLVRRGARRVVVVPVMVSSHSGHYDQVRYLAGAQDTLAPAMLHHLQMSGLARSTAAVPLTVTPALDAASELAQAVAARALSLAPAPAGRALFLLGHGHTAEDYAAWMADLRMVADSVRAATGFASVTVELVRDDAPAPVRAEAVRRSRELVELQRAATGKEVIVVPLLISSGDVSRRKLPNDLAGLPITYTGDSLLPHNGAGAMGGAPRAGGGVHTERRPVAERLAPASTSGNHRRTLRHAPTPQCDTSSAREKRGCANAQSPRAARGRHAPIRTREGWATAGVERRIQAGTATDDPSFSWEGTMSGRSPESEVEPPKVFRAFAERYPGVVEAYERLGEEVRAAGPLSPREVALVKLGISVGARMEGASHAHARKALARGIEPTAIEHVALLACPTIGFPNMMTTLGWIRDVLKKS